MSRSASITGWKHQILTVGHQLWATHGQAHWQGLRARERFLISVFLGLMGIWLCLSIAITPAVRTLQTSSLRRAEMGEQLAQMQALQQRAQALQKTKALSRDESLRNLQSITPTGNAALQMSVQGDRVLVQLKNLSASQLATWLAQARSQAQALPDEVHITRAAALNATNAAGVSSANASGNTVTAWDGQIVLRLPQRQVAPSNATGARP